MQIVIDIDDNLYTRLYDNGDEYVADMRRACVAIRKGIVLPKGHGRLIDADKYRHMWVDTFDSCYGDDCSKLFKDSVDYASTIIEADEEE